MHQSSVTPQGLQAARFRHPTLQSECKTWLDYCVQQRQGGSNVVLYIHPKEVDISASMLAVTETKTYYFAELPQEVNRRVNALLSAAMIHPLDKSLTDIIGPQLLVGRDQYLSRGLVQLCYIVTYKENILRILNELTRNVDIPTRF